MSNESPFKHIIGGSEQQKRELEAETEVALAQTGEDLYGDYLVEKTGEEKKMIAAAVGHANEVAAKYGSKHLIGTDRIFIVEPGGVAEILPGSMQAFCNDVTQTIVLDRTESSLLLALHTAHEAWHLTGYHSAQVHDDGTFDTYRNGLMMVGRDKEGVYLEKATEAVIATLVMRYYTQLIQTEPFKSEHARTEQIKVWCIKFSEDMNDENEHESLKQQLSSILIFPHNEDICALIEAEEDPVRIYEHIAKKYENMFDSLEFLPERKDEVVEFNTILEGMVGATGVNNEEGAEAKEKVFDLFAEAHFSGNYLPLARYVNGVAGRSDAFTELAMKLGQMEN